MNASSQKISVEQVAKVLNLTPNYIRYKLRIGELKIGRVRKPGKGEKHHHYDIYKNQVMKEFGLTEWPEEASK